MKLFAISSACILLAANAANAAVNVGVYLGPPVVPVYPVAPVYPEPVYVEPGYGYVEVPDWPSYRYDRHRYPHNHYWAHHYHHDEGRWHR